MTSTPPRTPSRPSTPLRASSASPLPARLTRPRASSQTTRTALPARLHPAIAATSSLASTPIPASSPASSVFNVDLHAHEGILVRGDLPEDDPEVGESEEHAGGVFADAGGGPDGAARRMRLREQLRKTLNRRNTGSSLYQGHQQDPSTPEAKEVSCPRGDLFPQRQYFVFTEAGKPVFVSRPADATEELASITGVTSALISVFADSALFPSQSPAAPPDKLRSINVGATRITFLLRPPLYYVCVSKWREPESATRMHLEYLHSQILSVFTASQLQRIFERRTNFDLRRLLEGAETFLHTMLSRLQTSFACCATLASIATLRLDPVIRMRAGDALVPASGKAGAGLDILYALLVSGDNIVTIVRPKKHSVHPLDLHILLNALHTPSIAANPASWLPLCLPKFNSRGFVHAYVSFLEQQRQGGVAGNGMRAVTSRSSGSVIPTAAPTTDTLVGGGSGGEADKVASPEVVPDSRDGDELGLALIIVSAGGEFDGVRRWSDGVVKSLASTGVMSLLRAAVIAAPYRCSELGIPGLRHFLYKSRVHVQVTSPVWEDEYEDVEDQRRLITLYQNVNDSIHGKSGQEGTFKLQYIRTEKEAVMGWITQPFELYIAISSRLPKTAAVGAANAVARWAKREEARLFLRDAPVF